MSAIKFSHLTKEIELKGSESFIESNFDKIKELVTESFGVEREMLSRRTKEKQEPMSLSKVKETQESAEMSRRNLSDATLVSPTVITVIPHISHEIRANRPPTRKYIRKVGFPGQERIMVETIEQKPKELSLAQLKEKFGLSESKKGGIIWNDQKHDKTRNVMNGGYI